MVAEAQALPLCLSSRPQGNTWVPVTCPQLLLLDCSFIPDILLIKRETLILVCVLLFFFFVPPTTLNLCFSIPYPLTTFRSGNAGATLQHVVVATQMPKPNLSHKDGS